MSQKINLSEENKDRRVPDTACQDHMIGELMAPGLSSQFASPFKCVTKFSGSDTSVM